MEHILQQIVARRRARLEQTGPEQGAPVPGRRSVPVLPFGRQPFVIAEIKRRSPSRGAIDIIPDPVAQARIYQTKGISTASVLTEEDYFAGSLTDLMEVKRSLPALAVLRKDFLLTTGDIEVSYRAGADAVLLIASILEQDQLAELYRRAVDLGMTPLVELHSAADVDKAQSLRPGFTGINARDLRTFRLDPAHPLKLRGLISWPTAVVYESGIRDYESALLPGHSGFAGLLVGEAAVRDPAQIPGIIRGFEAGRAAFTGASDETRRQGSYFWSDLFRRRRWDSEPGGAPGKLPPKEKGKVPGKLPPQGPGGAQDGSQRPLVKICGLTRRQDVQSADEAGADILGFILADVSPRATTPEFIRSLRPSRALRVAVVVGSDSASMPAVRQLLAEGVLNAVQFHGGETPEECAAAAYPYYKALPLRGAGDIEALGNYRCPRVLVDAYHRGVSGGTGKRIDGALVKAAAERHSLWLAGGLNPDNIAAVVRQYRPELEMPPAALRPPPALRTRSLSGVLYKMQRQPAVQNSSTAVMGIT